MNNEKQIKKLLEQIKELQKEIKFLSSNKNLIVGCDNCKYADNSMYTHPCKICFQFDLWRCNDD